MNYTISEAARKFNLTPHTIRYYENENIISPHRHKNGIRYFTNEDLEQIEMICCLKATGMSIKDIKAYFDLCLQGDKTLEKRMEIFTSHREHILNELDLLKKHLNKIDDKISWYKGFMESKRCD